MWIVGFLDLSLDSMMTFSRWREYSSVASSLKDTPVGQQVAVMGEVGLGGEVRAIPQIERRVAECARLGFTTIVLPKENLRRLKAPEGVTLRGVDTVLQALSVLF